MENILIISVPAILAMLVLYILYRIVKKLILSSSTEIDPPSLDAEFIAMNAGHISQQTEFFKESRDQSRIAFMFSIVAAVWGMILLTFFMLCLADVIPKSNPSLTRVQGFSALICQFISILFFQRSKAANKEAKIYFNDLREDSNMHRALLVINTFTDEAKKEDEKAKLISQFMERS